jgi:hypothetical protein
VLLKVTVQLEDLVEYEIPGLEPHFVILVVIAIQNADVKGYVTVLPSGGGACVENLFIPIVRRLNRDAVFRLRLAYGHGLTIPLQHALLFEELKEVAKRQLLPRCKEVLQLKFDPKVLQRQCSFLAIVLPTHWGNVVDFAFPTPSISMDVIKLHRFVFADGMAGRKALPTVAL